MIIRWLSPNIKLIWLIVAPTKDIDWALLGRILKSNWWYFDIHLTNKGLKTKS